MRGNTTQKRSHSFLGETTYLSSFLLIGFALMNMVLFSMLSRDQERRGQIHLRDVNHAPVLTGNDRSHRSKQTSVPRHRLMSSVVSAVLPPRPPSYVTLCSLLHAWPPTDPDPDPEILSPNTTSGVGPLPRFDLRKTAEREAAEAYRRAELPFLFYGLVDLDDTTRRWTDAYLERSFAQGWHNYKVERSKDQKFLYYKTLHPADLPVDWTPPQVTTDLSYEDYQKAAREADLGVGDSSLLYLTVSAGQGGETPWIRDAMPFFQKDPLFRVDQSGRPWHGINCRFGMKGIIQAAHYDGKRNFIAMVRGAKRYVIMPPSACSALELLPKGHPSARHASFDWSSREELERRGNHSDFCEVPAIEVVLQQGELLYLPSYWFHYIVSLDQSIQCNSRSGQSKVGQLDIHRCGFM